MNILGSIPGEKISDAAAHPDELKCSRRANAKVLKAPVRKVENTRIAHRPFAILVSGGQTNGGRVPGAINPPF